MGPAGEGRPPGEHSCQPHITGAPRRARPNGAALCLTAGLDSSKRQYPERHGTLRLGSTLKAVQKIFRTSSHDKAKAALKDTAPTRGQTIGTKQ